MTLTKSIRETLEFMAVVRKSSRDTVETYGRSLDGYHTYLKGQHLEDSPKSFTQQTVQGWIIDLGKRNAAGSTIINKLSALAAMHAYLKTQVDGRGRAIFAKDDSDSPMKNLEKPPQDPVETLFLYPDELKAFLEVEVGPELTLVRALVCDCFIRRVEVMEANVGDLKTVNGEVHLSIRVKGRRGKGKQRCQVPISAELAPVLLASIEGRDLAAPLLVDRTGRRWSRSQLSSAFIRIGQKAGLTRVSTSPHKIRHTIATLLLHGGMDIRTLAAMLNHRGLKYVERYAHLVPTAMTKARAAQAGMVKSYLANVRPDEPEAGAAVAGRGR